MCVQVFLAGVGSLMTEVAGQVCDGFFFHPFTTDRYLREVTLPQVTEAARAVLGGAAPTTTGWLLPGGPA